MANSKQSGSAAARRSQERQQRQKRDDIRASSRAKQSNVRYSSKRRVDRSGLYMVIGVVALLIVIVGLFIFISTLFLVAHLLGGKKITTYAYWYAVHIAITLP